MIKTLCIIGIKYIRPLLGPASCLFPLSCGNFAIQQLEQKPLASAIKKISLRLLLCNPITALLCSWGFVKPTSLPHFID